jgi:hypothetical protein
MHLPTHSIIKVTPEISESQVFTHSLFQSLTLKLIRFPFFFRPIRHKNYKTVGLFGFNSGK